MRFDSVEEIASWRLCLGCGACSWACKEGKVRLVDMVDDGIRPVVGQGCGKCSAECVAVCPGIEVSHSGWPQGAVAGLRKRWGPVLEIWEGHASDPEIRYNGSSGGVSTALALYCVERLGMYGAVHIGPAAVEPWKNSTYMSRTRAELLSRAGSRYSPASVCDGLGMMESAPSPAVLIGKPCDVSALRKAQAMSRDLDRGTGLAISIFCAGTPATRGIVELLKRFNIQPGALKRLRYRGRGWPGRWTAEMMDGSAVSLSYIETWGFLQKYRPLRCHLCPDGTGEMADVSCGDPWYWEPAPDEPGLSLVIARTELGRSAVSSAARDGYLTLRQVEPEALERSQEGLLNKRSAIWGRIAVMRAMRVPAPRLRGFSLLRNWMGLTAGDKARSIAGTARRVIRRRYYMKRPA